MLLDATQAQSYDAAIAQAAQHLADGHLLGLPTETVYGLAARADDDAAVAAIFQAKGRPANHPLIVHVPSIQAASQFIADGFLQQAPAYAQQLMQTFWPGPLTLIVPRHPAMAAAAAGGQDSVGLRCPAHPVALAVLQAAAQLGVAGVAAPSANLFGRVSPTTAQHVQQEFGSGLTVVDGGTCAVGIESTIVDCTRGQPVLLRPGMISVQTIFDRTGIHVLQPEQAAKQQAPRASGTLESHYAPQARVRIMSHQALVQALHAQPNQQVGIWARHAVALPEASPAIVHTMPANAADAAHALFAQLRQFDAQGVQEIWVEQVPATDDWAGVADRLRRAAA